MTTFRVDTNHFADTAQFAAELAELLARWDVECIDDDDRITGGGVIIRWDSTQYMRHVKWNRAERRVTWDEIAMDVAPAGSPTRCRP